MKLSIIVKNIIATGSNNGAILIWDLNKLPQQAIGKYIYIYIYIYIYFFFFFFFFFVLLLH